MNTSTASNSKDCPFCKKEIHENSFLTTSDFSALYNIAPILPGHSLIIPNLHYESLSELSEKEVGNMFVFARKVTSVLTEFFHSNGFDWTIQDGVAAGQTVPHLHLHIIPRKPFDMPENTDWYTQIPQNEKIMLDSLQREKLTDFEYKAITAQLKEACIHLPDENAI